MKETNHALTLRVFEHEISPLAAYTKSSVPSDLSRGRCGRGRMGESVVLDCIVGFIDDVVVPDCSASRDSLTLMRQVPSHCRLSRRITLEHVGCGWQNIVVAE